MCRASAVNFSRPIQTLKTQIPSKVKLPSVFMQIVRIGVRLMMALALSVWIGGLAFFGIVTAPIIFKMTRENGVSELAPQMVGLMLTRFGAICAICAAILVATWLLDGTLNRPNRVWKIQGAFLVLALALGAYLNFSFLPQTIRDQKAVLPIMALESAKTPLSASQKAIKARFDAGHQGFSRLARLNLWLLVCVLALLLARTLPQGEKKRVVK